MNLVATVESLWRYPVKSMCGERLESAFVAHSGIRGDRVYAIHDTAAQPDFPYLTSRQRTQMLLFRPRFRATGSPGALDVVTPDGRTLDIDDAALLDVLLEELDSRHKISLMRSEHAMTDAHPVSVFSLQTARRLEAELGSPIDKRRFRANIYIDLHAAEGFGEDQFVGRRLGIGETAVLTIVERDPRCKIITLDPDTAQANPEVIKHLAREYETMAGIYAAVQTEGTIREGDKVFLLPRDPERAGASAPS